MSDEKCDYLNLAGNVTVQKMLAKNGENNPYPERVIFSADVIKINRKDKEQTRTMLITDKAVYNLLPDSYGKCKRRIALRSLISITASTSSQEFVIHVPDEYDYRFKSDKKTEICDVLVRVYRHMIDELEASGQLTHTSPSSSLPRRLAIKHTSDSVLKDVALTKQVAKMLSREEIWKRKQELAAEVHDSDKEDEADAQPSSTSSHHQKEFTSLMSSSEKARLDDFELLKVLGRGSFGKVMQVKKKSDGNIYAMKILKKKAIVARNQVEHTKAERKILESLQHPFLMTLRYAFQSKDKLYFVLDYFQGGELFFHLKHVKRFPEEVARIYVAEIALALGHLHSLAVIYRDLKPENILLDDRGHVCLTDFGLSKDIEENNKAHTFCGTPEYLAPEIVAGAGHDKAVDWWSLGILLYELTVGIPPFYSKNIEEMYQKIQTGVLRFPPFLSDNCKSLIVALLHRDPKKRLGSADDDVQAIIHHPFFDGLNIDALMKKQIDVPYKPRVKAVDDTSNFDSTFTSEPVVDSVMVTSSLANATSKDAEADFTNFTYVPSKGSHLR